MFFYPIVSAKNWIPSNVVQLENCLHSSNITTIHKDLESYINPLLTEYSLLSVAIAVRMFLNIFNDNPGSTFSDIQDASIDSEIATSNLPQTPTINISTFVSCTIGLILSLPFLIAFICSFLGTVGSAEVYRIICTIFEIETLGLLLFSKLKLKSQFYEIFKNELPFNSYQILFLCVTSGAVAFETFEGIAGLMQGGKLICFMLFLNKILQVVANVEQTDMILHTKNVFFKTTKRSD